MFNKLNSQFGDLIKMEKIAGRKTGVQLFDPSDVEKVINLLINCVMLKLKLTCCL